MAALVRLTGSPRVQAGPLVVQLDALGGGQVRLALAFLLTLAGRNVPRSDLADVLWDQHPPPSWQPALRNILTRLRRGLLAAGLDDWVLQHERGTVLLRLPAGTVVDVLAAREQVERSEERLNAGEPAAALADADAAVQVLSQPFLAGEDGCWADSVRREHQGLRSRALTVSAQARMLRGEHAMAARAAQDLLDSEPLLETAWQLLMRALAAGGNRAEALVAYDRCRRLLVQELGVGPSVETEWVYLSLLADDAPSQDAAATAPAPAGRGSTHSEIELPLVGRAAELGAVDAAWSAVRAGHRRGLLIGGEAGIGKTRLAAAAAERLAAEGALVLFGRCDEDVPVPYQPFSEAFDQYVAAADEDQLRAELGWAARDLAALVVRLTQLLPDARSGPQNEDFPLARAGREPPGRLFEATAHLIRSVTSTCPLVLFLDDLHWADRPTTLLLRYLVRSLVDAPILVIATYRDDGSYADSPVAAAAAELARERGVVRLQLSGLDPEAVTDLLRAVGAGDAEPNVARRLVEQTGGNPFFLGELLQHVGRSRVPPDCEIAVPQTVTDAVRARFVRLSADAQRLLRAAAVLGESCDVTVLAELHGSDDDTVYAVLDEVQAARFLQAVDDAPGRVRFLHGLMRKAVYDEMTAARRARLHEQAAARYAPRGDPFAGEVARHLVAAGQPDRAVEPALAGARWAQGQRDDEQAVRLLDLALSRLGSEDERRLRALLDLGRACRRVSDFARAREAYRLATAEARRRHDAESLAEAALGVFSGATHGGTTSLDGGERAALLQEALEALGSQDSDLRVRVLSALAYAHYFTADRRALFAEEALAAARRVQSPRALSAALSAAWTARWGPHRTTERLGLATEMVLAAGSAGDREHELSARLIRLGDLVELGDRTAVDAELALAEALLDQAPLPWLRWRLTAWQALLAVVDGRDDAESLIGAALAARGDATDDNAAQCFGIQLVCLRLTQRRAHEVVDLVRGAVASYPMAPAYRCVLVLCLAESGRLDEARDEYEIFARDGFSSVTQDVNWITSMAALAEVCLHLGDLERAPLLHHALEPVADRMAVLDAYGGGGAFWGSIASLVGRLELLVGRQEAAACHLHRAMEANERFGAHFWNVRVIDALGCLAPAHRRPS
jgi:DNA-binding SARP family transcriptional activator